MKTIRILLALFFGWSLLKAISLLFRSASMDRIVFESAGLGWLFWLLLVCSIAGYCVALEYVRRPTEVPFWLALAGVAADLAITLVAVGIGFSTPGLTRQAFIASRQERGLSVREEMLTLMENPAIHIIPVVIAVIVAAVCAGLLYVVRWKSHGSSLQVPSEAAGP